LPVFRAGQRIDFSVNLKATVESIAGANPFGVRPNQCRSTHKAPSRWFNT
jgi:hypothetical protein